MIECTCGGAPEPVVALMHDGDEVREFYTMLCRECDADNGDVIRAVAAGAPREVQEDVLSGIRESWWPEHPCPYDLHTLDHATPPEQWSCDKCRTVRSRTKVVALSPDGWEETDMLTCRCDYSLPEIRIEKETTSLADFY